LTYSLYRRQNLVNKRNLFVLVSFLGLLCGCKREVQLQKNEYLLYNQSFAGNEIIGDETFESLVPLSQKPNNRPLYLPITPRVWWMNIGKNTFDPSKHQAKLDFYTAKVTELSAGNSSSVKEARLRKKYERRASRYEENMLEKSAWLWRTIGENPSIISEDDIKATAFKIKKFLFDSGFRDADVTYTIEPVKNRKSKVNLTYLIDEKTPYLIDSVVYDFQDDSLKIEILTDKTPSFVSKGLRFTNKITEAEKTRIEILARDKGYFNFSNKYITYGATNDAGSLEQFKIDKSGTLLFQVFNPDGKKNHQKFTVEEVTFQAIEYNSLLTKSVSDTVFINGIKFITNDVKIPLRVIDRRISTRLGSLYGTTEISETQRQIGLLNQFSFVSQQITQITDSTLRIDYFAPTLNRYGFTANPGVQSLFSGNNSNFTGFVVPFSFIIRNSLERLETIELSATAGVEGQPSPIDVSRIRGSLELGTNISLTFPSIILPFVSTKGLTKLNPKTSVGTGFNYSEPFWGRRLNFNLKTVYSWQPSYFEQFSFSLLDVSLINTIYSTGADNAAGNSFYNELVRQQQLGNNLKVTFDPQFVSSINASYSFNNQNIQNRYGRATYLRVFVESGGTILDLFDDDNKIGFIENAFPLNQSATSADSIRAYFQFVKINVDFRKNFRISKKSGWAYRVNVGVINPYGRNQSVPYTKNFFAGGSNSVRAWSPLSLGVGSAQPDATIEGNIIPQPGDILLESSIEYRKTIGNFFGDIQFATFIDAGNIWKWNQVPTKINQANFDINRFYKEIAVGTGFGIRYDLSYFLLRFDWGIKVVDPSQPLGQRFVLDNFSLKRDQPYGLQLQFGVGYPF
jgi:outer membrane protein insertion porin family